MSLTLRNRTAARDSVFSWDQFFAQPARSFTPAFEVKETPTAFVLHADVPGVAEADLEIAVHDNVLTVAGIRKPDDKKDDEGYALYERRFGAFTRSFALSEVADADHIDAKLELGVLTLTIAKRAAATPRKIAITKS